MKITYNIFNPEFFQKPITEIKYRNIFCGGQLAYVERLRSDPERNTTNIDTSKFESKNWDELIIEIEKYLAKKIGCQDWEVRIESAEI